MSITFTGIQGQRLEITVVGCNKLKDTEWISRQDPYVCLEYGRTKVRTRTCTDGDRNPTFQEKFVFTLIDGLREISVTVWNSNTLTSDVFIGSGKIQLQKVLSQGFDDTAWTLQTKTGRYAGEVRPILHYSNALKPTTSFASSAPSYATLPMPQVPLYFKPLSTNVAPYPTLAPATPYAPPAYPAPSPYSIYPPNSAGYPPSPYSASPPTAYPPPPYPPTSVYPPPPYPPPPPTSAYPPSPYSTSPPAAYPPPPYPPTSTYPPPPYPPPPPTSAYPPSPYSASPPAAYPPPPYPPTSASPPLPYPTPPQTSPYYP